MNTMGIDLGTTNSCIAKLNRDGNAEVIRNNADNTDTLPSVVFFETEDNVVVGENAKQMILTDGDRVVDFIKRDIGRPDGRQKLTFFGKDYTPIDISSLILRRLKQMAEEQGETVSDVVITVPAYFGFEEQAATRKAGEEAGLHVVDIISEPVAAMLSYCARQLQEEKTIMVYDLGGGTFDVTVMKVNVGVNDDGQETHRIEVLAVEGDSKLGGKDWEHYFKHTICQENGIQESDLEPEVLQAIRSNAEIVKKKLSTNREAKAFITVEGSRNCIKVTKEDFENMTGHLVDQTIALVDKVLQKVQNKAPDTEIDMVLLVGGSTFMPMIREAVEQKFPNKVQMHDPNHAVALGAAIYCDLIVSQIQPSKENPPVSSEEEEKKIQEQKEQQEKEEQLRREQEGLAPETPEERQEREEKQEKQRKQEKLLKEWEDMNQNRDTIFRSISSRSFGIGVRDKKNQYVIDNLIKKDSKVPSSAVKKYQTPEDNMEKIELRVFENLSMLDNLTPSVDEDGNDQSSLCNPADQVKYLGMMEIPLEEHTPARTPIEVTFSVENGFIRILVRNLVTGSVQPGEIKFSTISDAPSNATSLIVADDITI